MDIGNSSDFRKLYFRIAANDFMVNGVAGAAAGLFLALVQVIALQDVPAFMLYGFFVVAPFYLIHIYRIFRAVRSVYAVPGSLPDMDLRERSRRLHELMSIPWTCSRTILLIWLVAAAYAAAFCRFYLDVPYLVQMFGFLTLGLMAPIVWLVDMVVLKRMLLRLTCTVMESIPESLFGRFPFYRMSTFNRWALGVFYMVVLGIYLTLQTATTRLNSIVESDHLSFAQNHLTELATDFSDRYSRGILESSWIRHRVDSIQDNDIRISMEMPDGTRIGPAFPANADRFDQIIEQDVPGVGRLKAYVPTRLPFLFGELFQRGGLIFLILLLSVGVIVVVQAGRDFRGTLKQVQRIASRVAEGDLERSEGLYATDELWDLYQRLLVIKNNAARVLAGIRDYSRTVNETAHVVEEVTRFLQNLSIEQTRMMQNASDAIGFVDAFSERVRVSIGELSESAEKSSSTVVEFAAAVNQIKNSMHKLVGMAERVSSWVNESGTTAADITRNLNTVSSFSAQIQEQLEQEHRFLSESTDGLKDIREASESVSRHRATDMEAVEKLGDQVEYLSRMFHTYEDTRGSLRSELERVESVVGLVNDFVDQSEILALNAAIITAKTSSRDSGFGVIADEIKELAVNTGSSTQEIRSIISNILKEVDSLESTTKEVPSALMAMTSLVQEKKQRLTVVEKELEKQNDSLEVLLQGSQKRAEKTNEVLQGVRVTGTQIQEVFQALEEHVRENRSMLETSEQMKTMAEQVMLAAQEQTTGANHIAAESERIKDLSLNAREAVDKLKETMGELVDMIRTLRTNSEDMTGRSERLQNVIDNLAEEVRALSGEVSKFKLPTSERETSG